MHRRLSRALLLSVTVLALGPLQAAEPTAVVKPARAEVKAAAPLPPLQAPHGLSVAARADGALLSWQPVEGATRYLVLRGTGAPPAEPPLATLGAGSKEYLDCGFSAAGAYQVVALAADGRRAASGVVAFAPRPAPVTLPVPLTPGNVSAPTTAPMARLESNLATLPAKRGNTSSGAATFSITSVRPVNAPNSPSFLVRSGDTLLVKGAELAGISAVTLSYATQSSGRWVPNPAASKNYTALATEASGESLKFVLPEISLGINNAATLLVTLTKAGASLTSQDVILVGPNPSLSSRSVNPN